MDKMRPVFREVPSGPKMGGPPPPIKSKKVKK
jgi:hypothetical protein